MLEIIVVNCIEFDVTTTHKILVIKSFLMCDYHNRGRTS